MHISVHKYLFEPRELYAKWSRMPYKSYSKTRRSIATNGIACYSNVFHAALLDGERKYCSLRENCTFGKTIFLLSTSHVNTD